VGGADELEEPGELGDMGVPREVDKEIRDKPI
jgi:hypothetical protein